MSTSPRSMPSLQVIRRFCGDADGATAVEYGVMTALLAVVMMGVIGLMGDNIAEVFDGILSKFTEEVEVSAPSSSGN